MEAEWGWRAGGGAVEIIAAISREYKKLAAVGIRPTVRHGHRARLVMLNALLDLVLKIFGTT